MQSQRPHSGRRPSAAARLEGSRGCPAQPPPTPALRLPRSRRHRCGCHPVAAADVDMHVWPLVSCPHRPALHGPPLHGLASHGLALRGPTLHGLVLYGPYRTALHGDLQREDTLRPMLPPTPAVVHWTCSSKFHAPIRAVCACVHESASVRGPRARRQFSGVWAAAESRGSERQLRRPVAVGRPARQPATRAP
eukprot:365980-Chlamydomonas_euryale.AAC.12